jgi:hypothetical protein
MVRLSKTPLPSNVTITSEDDYRKGVVFQTLVADCHRQRRSHKVVVGAGLRGVLVQSNCVAHLPRD